MSTTAKKTHKGLGGFVGFMFVVKFIWSVLCFGAAATFVITRWGLIVSFILNR